MPERGEVKSDTLPREAGNGTLRDRVENVLAIRGASWHMHRRRGCQRLESTKGQLLEPARRDLGETLINRIIIGIIIRVAVDLQLGVLA